MDRYIGELLFQYDCVIIPGFGGFVASYAPATIHPTQHIFYPPSKNIVFNKNLKNNDGLLANHISSIDNISYSKANEQIKLFVDECNRKLRNKEKAKIEAVGELYLDVEGNIRFEPGKDVNYLVESFGLASFQSPPIKRESYSTKVEKQFKDRMPIPQQKKIRVKKLFAYTSVIIAIFSIAWLFIQTGIVKDVNYSNLNLFGKSETQVYKAREISLAMAENEGLKHNAEKHFIAFDTSKAITSISFSNESSQSILVKVKDAPDVENVIEEAVIKKYNPYHIIGGCFKLLENAEKLIARLQNKNIRATIIGQNNKGLYMVSCGDFGERDAAVNELARVKSTYNSEAWIFEKK